MLARPRLPNELGKVSAFLKPYRDDLAGVVVESTYNGYWLVDGLMGQGYRVHPANTMAIRDLLRMRSQLVRLTTINLLSIKNLFSRNRGESISGNRVTQLAPEAVDAVFEDLSVALAAKSNVKVALASARRG